MTNRLTALDAAFLDLERSGGPMHVGSVMVFEPGDTTADPEQLVQHITNRLQLVPRYRQRLHPVPGRIANPIWADDPTFSASNHIRRSAIPRPGSAAQLNDLVARLMPRRLDRNRPLWEVYVVDGVQDNRLALISKTHPALVDGRRSIDLLQAVLEDDPESVPVVTQHSWQPVPAPGRAGLIWGVVRDVPKTATTIVRAIRQRHDPDAAKRRAQHVTDAVRAARPVAPIAPLNPPRIGSHRRYTTYSCDLPTLRRIRDSLQSRFCSIEAPRRATVNDVVLAVLAGGLRNWLLLRQWPLQSGSVVRALVPVTVQLAPEESAELNDSSVQVQWVDLPVGESSPLVRLQRIAFQLSPHSNSAHAVGAAALTEAGNFIAPTVQALGLRAAYRLSHRLFNIAIVNVPGPQKKLYAAGLALTDMFPVLPVIANQALAVGVTSYRGNVNFGFHGDRDAMRDLDRFVACVNDSVEELSALSG